MYLARLRLLAVPVFMCLGDGNIEPVTGFTLVMLLMFTSSRTNPHEFFDS